ncbi:complex I subunit 5 family protein [Sulfuricystis thermophila]|uniref:complex I subunit 5 family protein n=1 Tax=Sulfuricystis thermophila TaxID=2496847 RepID=UPI001036E94F|nr:proton-conducting transporter membrane subunit [Sulfuricystis thermophila]
MSDPLIWLILLPLFWTTLAFLFGPARGAWLAITGAAAQLALAVALALKVGADRTAHHHPVGGWDAPLGIDLTADGLSAALLLLTQCVALPLFIYAHRYFRAGDPTGRYFWPLAGFLLAGMNALFASADLFNLYVTLELVGLAAVGLVAAEGGTRQLAAALRYLFATLVGSGLYLLGVALLYGAYGTVSSAMLTALVSDAAPRLVWIAAALMVVGLMVKTALFPFHFWLPPAHGGAPAPVSALLSALVVKASFYLLLRLWLGPFAALLPSFAGFIATCGAMAIFWGSWRAIRAERIKALIAWSTVAQLGYLFLIFPLFTAPAALAAGLTQVFAHGLAKAGFFAAAGVFIKTTGQDTVAGLAGAASRRPLTLFAWGLSGMTLMGLPPSAGFLAKWQLIELALDRGLWPIVYVVLAGGLMTAVYVFRVLRQAFLPATATAPHHKVPRTLEWMAFVLSAASVLIGLRAIELVALAGVIA